MQKAFNKFMMDETGAVTVDWVVLTGVVVVLGLTVVLAITPELESASVRISNVVSKTLPDQ